MGVQNIVEGDKSPIVLSFAEALLRDLRALEQMLESGMLERNLVRVGIEQEMFLVDTDGRPAPLAPEVLAGISDPAFTNEIGKFNLEFNMQPRILEAGCLRSMETELCAMIQRASSVARQHGADVLLTGILPSVRLRDLTLQNLTERPRYQELNRAVMDVRGGSYHLLIKGLDELQLIHDNVMPEACCTSFQVHMQLNPGTFARDYNASLLAAAPVLAVAVNSPILLGKRLWHETRIALFQHAVDERWQSHIARSHPTRVSFGDAWVRNSVLEIYREQIARFRVIMAARVEEDSLHTFSRGEVPLLKALVLHNSTVWRWNRPCFGITNGQPHLRLEFRALAAGPSVLDEVANSAFFLGLMRSLPEEYGDVSTKMQFDDAKDNFFAAARHGLKAQFKWIDGKHYSAPDLIKKHLLPLAVQGLREARIDAEDIARYLGVIKARLERGVTGSQWMLSAAASLSDARSRELRDQRLVAAMLARQKSGQPVHAWNPISQHEAEDLAHAPQNVAEIMATDLFTVTPGDPITLAASMMDWRHIRHLPVEENGQLVGLVSSRDVLHFLAARPRADSSYNLVSVREIMTPSPETVNRQTRIADALQLMVEHRVDCLPVVDGLELVGVVTSRDMLEVLSNLLKTPAALSSTTSQASAAGSCCS